MSKLTSSPQSPSHTDYTASNHILSSPRPNLNTFGRSNTLDRKSKQQHSMFSLAKTPRPSKNPHYSSLERKTLTDSPEDTSNYRLFSTKKTIQEKLAKHHQLSYHGSPQRNSLNLTMKPPSVQLPDQRNLSNTFVKRPLGQDTILENTIQLAEFQQRMSSTPTSPDHYGCLLKGQTGSPGLKLELENARNQIFQLTNQLSISVSSCFVFDVVIRVNIWF